ncbi:cytochrome b561 [Paraburkholderia diazotrophica]|uniref:Cytochrome b561 n=2 Tax=Paraburkholderia diazotrophica TaxID=667676 RepID=A0A1H7CSZ0_9BURK|nr:cytochrome b561 [Paraburkholderia diazotrophica]
MIEGTDIMNATRSTDVARREREAPTRYPMSLIVLHWLIAFGIIAMLAIGLYMVGLPRGLPFKATLINFHKSLGLTIFLLVLIRIGVLMVSGRPPLPPMRAWQRAAASATQVLLYVSMIAMPVTGYLGSSFNTYGTRFWGLLLPKWGWDDKPIREFWFGIHEIAAWIFIVLIALHVAGAIKHQLIDRDGLLRRMLP